jgi:hypothetical protein
VMQPIIDFGDAPVAHRAAVASHPGQWSDRSWPVLAVFGQPLWIASRLSSGALARVMPADLEALAFAGYGCNVPAARNRRRPRRRQRIRCG